MSLISSGILYAILAQKIGIVLRMEELDAWTPFRIFGPRRSPRLALKL
jgi:hypothetical protein